MFKKCIKTYWEILFCTFIAILLGVIIGALDTLFGRVLLAIGDIRMHYVFYFVPFLGLAGIFILWLYNKFSALSLKGMTLIFNAGLNDKEQIPPQLIPLVMISTWITHLFGGSAGREGVAVQLGATVSHTLARKFKLTQYLRIFLIVGMAAGFAGLFQTPIAASFFALEVLIAGSLQYSALLPVLAGAFTASYTSHLLGLEKFSVNIAFNLNVSPSLVIKLVILGICFGVVGGGFAHLLSLGKKYVAKWQLSSYMKIFIVGVGLSFILLLLYKGRYCGLGTNLINASFNGKVIYSYDWLLKLLLTLITLSVGYQGGEVTPLFSIGASLGIVLGQLLGLPLELTAALGYAAVFGGATNTLLAPIFIGAEVFGPTHILYFAVVCGISYVFNGNKTIYTSQQRYEYMPPSEVKNA